MSYAHLPENVVETWPKLSGPAKAVVVAIASRMNGKAGKCHPGQDDLSERSGIHRRRSISEAIGELKRLGLITVKRRPNKSSEYRWGLGPDVAPIATTGCSAERHNQHDTKQPGCSAERPPDVAPSATQDITKDINKKTPKKESRAPRKPRRFETPHPDVAPFIKWYPQRYEETFGEAPKGFKHGKAGKLIKELLEKDGLTLEKLKQAAEAMFADRWSREHGEINIGRLYKRIDKWRLLAKKPAADVASNLTDWRNGVDTRGHQGHGQQSSAGSG